MTVLRELYPYPFVVYLIMSICFSLCVDWISVPPTNSYDFLGNQFYYTEYRPLLFCWGRTPSANTIGFTGITFNISSISSFISCQYLWSTVPQDMLKDHLWVGSFSKTRAMEKLYKMFRFLKKTHILILQSNSFHILLLMSLWLFMHVSSETKFN